MLGENCVSVKFSEGLGIFNNHYGYPEIDKKEQYKGQTGRVIDILGIQAHAGHNFLVPEGKELKIEIDKCQFFHIAIKAEKDTSTCLFLMIYDKKPYDHLCRFVIIGKTQKGNSGFYDIGKDCFTIKDDSKWHEYNYDLRKIRDYYQNAGSIREIQFYTWIGTGKHAFHFNYLFMSSKDNEHKYSTGKGKDEPKAKKHSIGSIEELRRLAPSLIEAANSDDNLVMLAAANPILAVEDLGYSFTDEFRPNLERVFRFSTETVKRLETLEKQIHKIAGHSFNIESPTELEHVLFDNIGLPRIHKSLKVQIQPSRLPSNLPDLPTAPLHYQMNLGPKIKDPLEELKDTHPIMKPLLSYRQLEASQPRLAPPEIYEKIKRGEVKLPLTQLKFRIVRDPTPE